MTVSKKIVQLVPLVIITLGLLTYNFMSAQSSWSGPTATAPDNNTDAPVNVGGDYQIKAGNLGVVSMRAGEYCDALGLNCIADLSKLVKNTTNNAGDTITIGGKCFESRPLFTCNWNWSGDGNDNYRSFRTCASMGRTDQGETTYVLAECISNVVFTYAWQVPAWSYCYVSASCSTAGSQSRSVVCKRSDTTTVADSYCTSPKPISVQSCVGSRHGSDC